MTDERTRRYNEDDPDELWDDDLRLASEVDDKSQTDPDQTELREYTYSDTEYGSSSDDYNIEDTSDYYVNDDVSLNDAADAGVEKEDKKTRRKKFFGITDEEDGNDYFDNDTEPEPAPKPKPKPVKLDPEDPDYWMDEESDFDHIIPRPRKSWIWWTAGAVILIGVIAGLWMWFLTPHTDGAVKYGYLKSMERRGTFMKTYEGVLIPYRELGDSTPTYFEEIRFSVDGDSLAAHMKGMMLNCIPVRLEYEIYHTPLFWKGAEMMVIVKADTADEKKILPPEYRWKKKVE